MLLDDIGFARSMLIPFGVQRPNPKKWMVRLRSSLAILCTAWSDTRGARAFVAELSRQRTEFNEGCQCLKLIWSPRLPQFRSDNEKSAHLYALGRAGLCSTVQCQSLLHTNPGRFVRLSQSRTFPQADNEN